MQSLRVLIASASLAAFLSAQDLNPPQDAGSATLEALSVTDAGLVVVRAEGELHRSSHGGVRSDIPMAIGSASRWLTVATILTLVDEEKLDLDRPVATYVEQFARPDKNMLTLRQCLSCTSGVVTEMKVKMHDWDMDKFADEIGAKALREHPGMGFRDGDIGFQIAAIAAVRVTGKNWHDLFRERIAEPLGMKSTRFGALQPLGKDAGTTALPWVGGGAVSTIDDYASFVRMLVCKGRVDDGEVLKADTVAMMWSDQVPSHVDVSAKWFESERLRYGLGTWIDSLGDETVRVSAPARRNFASWLDLDLGIAGVCAAPTRGEWIEALHDVQCDVRTALLSPKVSGTAAVVKLTHEKKTRRYTLHVPPDKGQGARPLLLVLHCDGGSADQVGAVTGLGEAGVRAGFVVGFPEGSTSRLRKLLGWNARNDGIGDDVGFLRAVVEDIKKRTSIDPARVYAIGRGGGGAMCHRLARQARDMVSGIAAVDGAMTFTLADDTTPIAAMLVHATEAGATEKSKALAAAHAIVPVDEARAYYLARNGLVARPVTTNRDKVRFDAYTTSKDGEKTPPVHVITIEGGRHTWPGAKSKGTWIAGAPGSRFDASAAILEFFTSLGAKK